MAMLQAARAKSLGLPLRSAYSWGLNRAIFYAAAKRGFATPSSGTPTRESPGTPGTESTYYLGDDKAYISEGGDAPTFIIGDKPQTEADFRRQIADRFGTKGLFETAWAEAEGIVAGYDRDTLSSGRAFFDRVYRPRRDELAAKWTEALARSAPPGAGAWPPPGREPSRSGSATPGA